MSADLLFPIELLGNDSADVESLPSYIHRCAFEHGVYVGELIRFAYKNGIKHVDDTHQEIGPPKYIKVPELVRPERSTRMLVDVFSYMTKQSLGNSVLWFINNSLGRSRNEIVKGFRWCPECFSEMGSLEQEPYFKLIWHMTSVKACHIHRTPLIEKCEFCGCDQTSFKKQRAVGLCQRCGKSLSKRKHAITEEQIYNSWDDIGLDMVRLFKDLSSVPINSLPYGGIKQSLESLYDVYWKKDCEKDFFRLLSKNEMLAVVFGPNKVSLKTARKIAYRLGVSLFELMSGEAAKTNEVLDKRMFCKLPIGYLEPERKVKKDHEKILKHINKLLRRSATPIPWRKISEKVGVSVGYLDYRYPLLAKDVKRRYENYIQKERLKKIYTAQKVAMQYFFDEKYSGQAQSRKQAYRVLRAETGLPKFMLKKAIQNAYAAIH